MRIGASVSRWKAAAVAQSLLALAIFGGLAFAPPSRGEMLLIPLNGHPISPALLKQLPLVAERSGPLSGSLLVFGSSEGQFVFLLERGVLILAAPQAICGGSHGETVE